MKGRLLALGSVAALVTALGATACGPARPTWTAPTATSSTAPGPELLDAGAATADCARSPWGCAVAFGGWTHEQPRPGSPRVAVIGDSLVQGLQNSLSDTMADQGSSAWSAGVGGSAFWHWNTAQYLSGDIAALVRRHQARHVILALGNNDARVLAGGTVNDTQVREQIRTGLRAARSAADGCIVVVSPATWPSFAAQSSQVRTMIAEVVAEQNEAVPDANPFVVADWGAHAGTRPDWFLPGDVHLSPGGKLAYAGFLTLYADYANSGSLGC